MLRVYAFFKTRLEKRVQKLEGSKVQKLLIG